MLRVASVAAGVIDTFDETKSGTVYEFSIEMYINVSYFYQNFEI